MNTKLLRAAAIGVICFSTVACGTQSNSARANSPGVSSPNGNISVLYAGSLTANMEQDIGPAFTKDTGIKFEGEGAGSSQLAQKIRSGLRDPDIFISASPSVNSKLLMGPANRNLANWYLTFARDELVIAYSPQSKFTRELSAASGSTPWYKVVQEKGFLLGRTDPKLDPKGASTVLMFDLAEKFYHQPGLADSLMGGAIENTSQVYPEETLLARLKTGQLDAVIAYKHEAVDWKVPYVSLPSDINLGDESKSKLYSTVSISTGAGQSTKGAPILFTVTIPRTVKNERAAEAFVQYIVAGAGHRLLMQEGFTPVSIDVGGSQQAVPDSLRNLIQGTHK